MPYHKTGMNKKLFRNLIRVSQRWSASDTMVSVNMLSDKPTRLVSANEQEKHWKINDGHGSLSSRHWIVIREDQNIAFRRPLYLRRWEPQSSEVIKVRDYRWSNKKYTGFKARGQNGTKFIGSVNVMPGGEAWMSEYGSGSEKARGSVNWAWTSSGGRTPNLTPIIVLNPNTGRDGTPSGKAAGSRNYVKELSESGNRPQ